MSADLQDFKDIIEQLKSVISEPDFDRQFKAATQDIAKAKQFLIKVELKRLAQPSNRQIDLRGNVQGEPFIYEHKGLIHYLDELAKTIFEQQVNKFGRYTVGVFEAVMAAENNNRVLHKKEQQQRLADKNKQLTQASEQSEPRVSSKYGVTAVPFTKYGIRNEERMNFSINVEIQFGVGNVLKASTRDLSISGAKVKIPETKEVAVGQKLALYLTGLEQEFKLELKDGIQYEIVGIDKAANNSKYIRMKRTFLEEVPGLDDFLAKLINDNKRRYKVNLECTLNAVMIKGFEQYYLPRTNTLPVFLRNVKGRLLPTMALATENNRSILHYFSDENNALILQQILNETRINRLIDANTAIKETTLFCFTHAKAGRLYFYSATAQELEEHAELRSLFIGFGSSKPSWQTYKLQLVASDEQGAFIPLSIPDCADPEIKKLNQRPSATVDSMLKDIRYVAMLTPLNGSELAQQYQNNHPWDRALVQALKQFGHAKLKRYININIETLDYVNLRSEQRYLYKTTVKINAVDGEHLVDGAQLTASTRDFSTQGLQVVLPQPCDYEKGQIIHLALPDMQKITKAFDLTNLPYEIIAVSKSGTIMNLKIFEQDLVHNAKPFFSKLIRQNQAKLTPASVDSPYPGLSHCLRNLTAKTISHIPIYFSKESNRVKVNTIGTSFAKNRLEQLLVKFKPNNGDASLYPILQNNAVNRIFVPELNKMNRRDKPTHLDLYLSYHSDQEQEQNAFIGQFEQDFASSEQQHNFVQTNAANGCLLVYRIYLSRTGRPDMEFISKELNYVSHYAIHRAKELEELLWSISGIGEIVDITEEVLFRYNTSSELIKAQQVKRNQLVQ